MTGNEITPSMVCKEAVMILRSLMSSYKGPVDYGDRGDDDETISEHYTVSDSLKFGSLQAYGDFIRPKIQILADSLMSSASGSACIVFCPSPVALGGSGQSYGGFAISVADHGGGNHELMVRYRLVPSQSCAHLPPKMTNEKLLLEIKAHIEPIKIYDVTLDVFRPATQQDVDMLVQVSIAYSKMIQISIAERDRLKAVASAMSRSPIAQQPI